MNVRLSGEFDWLKKWAMYAPRAVALKDADTGRELTYGDFYRSAIRLARRLRDGYAIGAGDRVAVLAQNELEYVQLFFATQRLGAILVPINFRLTGREVNHILRDSSPKLLIHQRQFSEVLERIDPAVRPPSLLSFERTPGSDDSLVALAEVPAAEAGDAAAFAREAAEVPLDAREETPVMILYTSGTTGSPKGAIVTQGMLYWNSINTTFRLNLTQSDVTLSFLPLFHTGGWNVLTTPFLHRGARVVLLKKFEADRILELCDRERVTILFGVPTTLDMMQRSPAYAAAKLDSVRYAIVGGEPMPLELIKIWQLKGIPVRQGYGLTEFGPNVFSLNEEDSLRKIGSIGFPNFYIDAKIVDDAGHELGADEIGELVLRGPMCTAGYWRNPEATAQTIRDGWLHTGDLVRRDAEGYYYVVGRKKDMFISGGENVYPPEVEQYLRSHPGIREVAVVGVPDARWGEVGKAFVVRREGEDLSASDVLAYCSGNLAKYKIPKHVEFLADLPKGDSGKILKRKLLEERVEASIPA